VNVPAAHVAHCRSTTGLPGALTWVPAAQLVQATQLVAFDTVLNAPLAHAVQVRSEVEVPAAPTSWPGAHDVHGTHAVAGFPSWSQVPSVQLARGVVPPAQ